jgi:hypothetical protein
LEFFHRLNEVEATLPPGCRAGLHRDIACCCQFDGLRTPNANGDLPFINGDPRDPTKPISATPTG